MKRAIGIFSIITIVATYLSMSTGCSKATNSACIDPPSDTIRALAPSTFTSSCSAPNITSYTWSFGDGSPSIHTPSATHTYASIGTYTVSLIVVTNGNSSTATRTVTVVHHAYTPQDFVGTYSVTDACQYTVNYSETISISGSTATIANLGNHGTNLTGNISGSTITIPSQNFYTSGCVIWTVSGSGSLSENDSTLNISFAADSANISNTCSAIGRK